MTEEYPTDRAQALQSGLKKYLGGPCRTCSGTLRHTSTRACVQCLKVYSLAYSKTESCKLTRKAYNQTDKVQDRKSAYMAAYGRLRQIGVKKAFMPWADREKITALYSEAKLKGLQVDHIIPLKHPLVCGLHVEHNLQLLTPEDNRRKFNHFTSDWEKAF